MRWLVWYLRSMFCDHAWKYEEANYTKTNNAAAFTQKGQVIAATCEFCGWHRSYWKHDP